jgi:4-carboxymuconolactone decarboxylase
MRGPFSVLMHVPALADRVEHLESYFRTEGELPAADRELIILATVREAEARFAWARHEARAKEAETNPEAIEVLRTKSPADKLPERERIIVDFARTLLREHAVSDELYNRTLKELGQTQLVETVALMGNYSLIGLLIGAFAIPEDSKTF